MNWDFIWLVVSRTSNILSLSSVIISFALWLSFGKFKKEIESQRLKYIEEQQTILTNLTSIYKNLYTDDNKTDDVISELRKQIYAISKKFMTLLKKNELRYVKNIMKILHKETDKMDFADLRKNLDFIITAFTGRTYD